MSANLVGLIALAASNARTERELPAPPFVFGLTAFFLLCLLLAVTLMFNRDR
jgi:hypothetical protein